MQVEEQHAVVLSFLCFHVLSFAPIYKKLVALVSLYRPDLDYKYVNNLTVKLAMRHNRNLTAGQEFLFSVSSLSPIFCLLENYNIDS